MTALQDILKLSTKERLQIIEEIWDSISDEDLQPTTAQKVELDRRLNRLKSGEETLKTWAEVKSKLKK